MNIRIRSITMGLPMEHLAQKSATLRALFTQAEKVFEQKHYPVDTKRIVYAPLTREDFRHTDILFSRLLASEAAFAELDIRWFCLPVRADKDLLASELLSAVPKLVGRFPKMFLHFMTAYDGQAHLDSLIEIADAIIGVSKLSANGYDNFRVGVGANIRPNTPFFPFSYHDGEAGFSVAMELIGGFIEAAEEMNGKMSASELMEKVVQDVAPRCTEINELCLEIEKSNPDFVYKGMDLSLAPYPSGNRSVGLLLEQIAPNVCGDSGTLSATALLTKTLRAVISRTGIRSAGFNGVMFSPLEDKVLAKRLGRQITLEKLMLYSTVCGCGIDMVPLPGNIRNTELASIMQDVSVLSTVLKKPLGVRVLPIPMKSANQLTEYNHDFLANAHILELNGEGLLRDAVFQL